MSVAMAIVAEDHEIGLGVAFRLRPGPDVMNDNWRPRKTATTTRPPAFVEQIVERLLVNRRATSFRQCINRILRKAELFQFPVVGLFEPFYRKTIFGK